MQTCCECQRLLIECRAASEQLVAVQREISRYRQADETETFLLWWKAGEDALRASQTARNEMAMHIVSHRASVISMGA